MPKSVGKKYKKNESNAEKSAVSNKKSVDLTSVDDQNAEKSEVSKEPETFSVIGQRMLITIPHFDKLEEVYKLLELSSEEKLIEKFAVVLETHTNDPNKSNHLHIFVKFIKRREIGLNFFDFLGKHGKVESVRNEEAVLQYINKENVCKANFDVWEALLETPSTFANTVRRMMLSGWEASALVRKYGRTFANRPWQTALRLGTLAVASEIAESAKPTLRLRKITREIIESRLDPEELRIFDNNEKFGVFVDYVNKILQYGNQQLHKQCCLSLVGEPSIGKSTVVNELKKFFNTYVFPLDGWHTQYENGLYEIILWNEWDIKLLSRSDLLLFTEGEIVDLKVKYTKAVKRDRPMIILTANHSYQYQVHKRYHGYDPEYHDMMLKALAVRFVELNFESQSIWFLTKLFVATTEDVVRGTL